MTFSIWLGAGGRVPGAGAADRVLSVGHGRGRGHALLRAAVPQTDPATRRRRDLHHGLLDARLRHHAPAIPVSSSDLHKSKRKLYYHT